MIASIDPARDGLWALKGDRIDGLDVYVLDGPPTKNGLPTKGTHVSLKQVAFEGGLVWELTIKKLMSDGKSRLNNLLRRGSEK